MKSHEINEKLPERGDPTVNLLCKLFQGIVAGTHLSGLALVCAHAVLITGNSNVKFLSFFLFLFCSLFQHFAYSQGGCRHVAYTCIGARYVPQKGAARSCEGALWSPYSTNDIRELKQF